MASRAVDSQIAIQQAVAPDGSIASFSNNLISSLLMCCSLAAGELKRWAASITMTITEFHASHIGRVAVSFHLSSPNLDPCEVTRALGIRPELVSGSPSTHGFWSMSSQGKVEAGLASKDINEHFRYLLRTLLPVRDSILKFTQGGETYFDVLWESSYLYAGTGPEISADCIAGICQLNAGLGFDIYQIEANDP